MQGDSQTNQSLRTGIRFRLGTKAPSRLARFHQMATHHHHLLGSQATAVPFRIAWIGFGRWSACSIPPILRGIGAEGKTVK